MGNKQSKQSEKNSLLKRKKTTNEYITTRASQLSLNRSQGEESRPREYATLEDTRPRQLYPNLSQVEMSTSREYASVEDPKEQHVYVTIDDYCHPEEDTSQVQNNKEQIPKQTKLASTRFIVAAIDFGTTFSGLAYSIRHEIVKDPEKVFMIVTREPTSVLFKPDKTFFKFGKDAEGYMQENPNEEELTEYYFFQHFKMSLYNTKNLSKDTMLLDMTEKKQLPAIDVFSSVISYFKARMEEELDRCFISENGASSDMIYWVLTCPAIWNLKAKQFMREAAEKAGIDSAYLAIALEPEAASIFCSGVKLNILKEESNYEFSSLGEGSKYLILDLGGGTVDITAHQFSYQTGLKELHQASGNDAGGNRVNQEFVKFIETLIGSDRLKSMKENHLSDWIDILNNFETKKCCYTQGSQVIFRLPQYFQEVFKETDVSRKVPQSSFQDEFPIVQDKVKISGDLFKRFFKPSITGILEHVRPILAEHVNIKHMLVVGGLAESSIVISAIQEAFPNVKVLVPRNPRSAVLQGAVVFGFKPEIIQARVSRYTYGIAKQRRYNAKTDPVKKRKVHNGRYYCDDVFDKHVTLGDTLRIGEYQESREYHPVQDDQILAHLEFYASTEKNPRFVTDDSCHCLGFMEITLTERDNREDGTVAVRINFSGTELEIEAVEKRTGQRTEATCNFLG